MTYQIVVILKALVEVALVAYLGRGALYVLAGASRDRNPIYGLFRIVTSPVDRVARLLAPRFVLDRHIPLFGLFLLIVAEVALIVAKVYLALAAAGRI